MLSECKRNAAIKYAIFDDLDRFMRAMLETAHFIVEFKKLGVKVVFASQPNLTTDTAADSDRERFLRFAFNFVENMGSRFLELSPINRLGCKQASFYLDTRNKVYTSEISLLIRLAGTKKDLSEPEKSLLVRVRRL